MTDIEYRKIQGLVGEQSFLVREARYEQGHLEER